MPAFKAEIAYLNARLAASIRQGERAAGQCARTAHEGLATLYRGRLAELRRERGVAARLSPQRIIARSASFEPLPM